MKNLDFKMRQRFEKREYEGITRLEKIAIKQVEKEKKQSFLNAIALKEQVEEMCGVNAPIVHGVMKYQCEECSKSWFMFLEIGVEDNGQNGKPHQPCPFCIPCTCGGIARDISGYIPFSENTKLEKGMRYFAYDNSGKEFACGKATVY